MVAASVMLAMIGVAVLIGHLVMIAMLVHAHDYYSEDEP